MVTLSRAIWKQKRLEEALILLQSAGEAFLAMDKEGDSSFLQRETNDGRLGSQCDATRCFVKVAAAYDALGWHRLAENAWNRVSDTLLAH